MADKSNFNETVASLFKGMDAFLAAKTVVGEPITAGDGTILVPLVDVSFGVGAGAFAGDKKNNGAGGMSGKISPNAILVIRNGQTKLVSVKSTDNISKLMDNLPDMVDKIKAWTGKDNTEGEEI